jgi:SRSO17 transposase
MTRRTLPRAAGRAAKPGVGKIDKEDRVAVSELAGATGLCLTIEECFQRAKEELGLDHCKTRSWHGWHRHMMLCVAAVFLARLSTQPRRSAERKGDDRSLMARAA